MSERRSTRSIHANVRRRAIRRGFFGRRKKNDKERKKTGYAIFDHAFPIDSDNSMDATIPDIHSESDVSPEKTLPSSSLKLPSDSDVLSLVNTDYGGRRQLMDMNMIDVPAEEDDTSIPIATKRTSTSQNHDNPANPSDDDDDDESNLNVNDAENNHSTNNDTDGSTSEGYSPFSDDAIQPKNLFGTSDDENDTCITTSDIDSSNIKPIRPDIAVCHSNSFGSSVTFDPAFPSLLSSLKSSTTVGPSTPGKSPSRSNFPPHASSSTKTSEKDVPNGKQQKQPTFVNNRGSLPPLPPKSTPTRKATSSSPTHPTLALQLLSESSPTNKGLQLFVKLTHFLSVVDTSYEEDDDDHFRNVDDGEEDDPMAAANRLLAAVYDDQNVNEIFVPAFDLDSKQTDDHTDNDNDHHPPSSPSPPPEGFSSHQVKLSLALEELTHNVIARKQSIDANIVPPEAGDVQNMPPPPAAAAAEDSSRHSEEKESKEGIITTSQDSTNQHHKAGKGSDGLQSIINDRQEPNCDERTAESKKDLIEAGRLALFGDDPTNDPQPMSERDGKASPKNQTVKSPEYVPERRGPSQTDSTEEVEEETKKGSIENDHVSTITARIANGDRRSEKGTLQSHTKDDELWDSLVDDDHSDSKGTGSTSSTGTDSSSFTGTDSSSSTKSSEEHSAECLDSSSNKQGEGQKEPPRASAPSVPAKGPPGEDAVSPTEVSQKAEVTDNVSGNEYKDVISQARLRTSLFPETTAVYSSSTIQYISFGTLMHVDTESPSVTDNNVARAGLVSPAKSEQPSPTDSNTDNSVPSSNEVADFPNCTTVFGGGLCSGSTDKSNKSEWSYPPMPTINLPSSTLLNDAVSKCLPKTTDDVELEEKKETNVSNCVSTTNIVGSEGTKADDNTTPAEEVASLSLAKMTDEVTMEHSKPQKSTATRPSRPTRAFSKARRLLDKIAINNARNADPIEQDSIEEDIALAVINSEAQDTPELEPRIQSVPQPAENDGPKHESPQEDLSAIYVPGCIATGGVVECFPRENNNTNGLVDTAVADDDFCKISYSCKVTIENLLGPVELRRDDRVDGPDKTSEIAVSDLTAETDIERITFENDASQSSFAKNVFCSSNAGGYTTNPACLGCDRSSPECPTPDAKDATDPMPTGEYSPPVSCPVSPARSRGVRFAVDAESADNSARDSTSLGASQGCSMFPTGIRMPTCRPFQFSDVKSSWNAVVEWLDGSDESVAPTDLEQEAFSRDQFNAGSQYDEDDFSDAEGSVEIYHTTNAVIGGSWTNASSYELQSISTKGTSKAVNLLQCIGMKESNEVVDVSDIPETAETESC